jgi:hypothetical protein
VRPDGSGLDGAFGTTSPGVTLVNVNGDTSNTTSISDLKIDPFDNIFVTGNYNGSGHQQMMLGLLTATGRVLTTEANDNALGVYGDQFAAALAIQPDYLLVNGKWTSHPIDVKKEAGETAAAMKARSQTCTRLGEETLAGQAAKVYAVHSNDADADSKVWIANASGLLLGQDIANDGAGGNGMSIRYDYANIQPPKL